MIPKANGKMRSLGVPSAAWRLYLAGLNQILLVWLSSFQHKNQHGFIPKRGTDSAWKHIYEKVLSSRNIYEFDLKEFFDRVNLDYLGNILNKIEIPLNLVTNIISFRSRTKPRNNDTSTDLNWESDEEKNLSLSLHQRLNLPKSVIKKG